MKILWGHPLPLTFLLAFTLSIKTLESNMISRSLVLNKALHQHTSNAIKNTHTKKKKQKKQKQKQKKTPKHRILKKNMRNKSNYEEKFK